MSDRLPVKCGLCGEELDHLGALNDGSHHCEEKTRFDAFMMTGDPEVF